MNKAMVILSGGQDSTTCLFWAKEKFDEVHAITFNYEQRHRREVDSARIIANMAGVASHEVVWIPTCLQSASPLTSLNELDIYDSFEAMEAEVGQRIEKTFVPMRNALFLTVAMNRSVACNCRTLVTGICQADNANYPDCTEAFRAAFEKMANTSLGVSEFSIEAPLMNNAKADTVRMAYDMRDNGCWKALAYSHTSYGGEYPPVQKNHSNLLRAQGFLEAGLPDPLVVRAYVERLMPLPGTPNYQKELYEETRRIIGL